MKHMYNTNTVAFTLQPAAKALGTAISSKIIFLLLVGTFLLLGGKGMAQNITSVNPNCALQGQDVRLTISGTGFRNDGSGNSAQVVVNNTEPYIIPTTLSATSITVTVPRSRITGASFAVRVRQKNQNDFEVSNELTVNIISLVAQPGQRCDAGSVTLTASGAPDGGVYRWYTSPTSTTPVFTGASYSTPSIATTTAYYVSVLTSPSGCETGRVAVQAVIGDIKPVVSSNGRCTPGTVTLTASGAPVGGDYRWYTSETSTMPVATGSSYTTPEISTSTTYYVSIYTTCESSKVPVVARIGNPTPPIVTSNGDCGNGNPTITLTASGAVGNETYRWYDATNVNPISVGPTLSRSRNSQSGMYYATIYDEAAGCESGRTPIYLTNQAPGAPTAINGIRCGSGTVVLRASGAEHWESYRWYAAQSGGFPLGEGLTFTTPSIPVGTSVNYYVSKVNTGTGCDGVRVLVTATALNANPAAATGNILVPDNLKANEPATISYESNIPTSEIEYYQWYYRTTESSEWKLGPPTSTFEFESMPSNINGFRLDLTVYESNSTCYSNLTADRVFRIDNESITPLPVELISFNAQRHTKGVNLTWVTASELDNKGFEVQVSTDSRNFTAIGFVESKVGTTSMKQYYNFLDTKAVSGTRYYRLKQIDFDGTSAFSNIRAVSLNGDNGVIAAYPNPFDDVVVVTLNGTEARKVHVILTNSMGKVIQESIEETSGNSISVDMTRVTAKGMYMLHVMDNGSKHVFKLMKR